MNYRRHNAIINRLRYREVASNEPLSKFYVHIVSYHIPV